MIVSSILKIERWHTKHIIPGLCTVYCITKGGIPMLILLIRLDRVRE